MHDEGYLRPFMHVCQPDKKSTTFTHIMQVCVHVSHCNIIIVDVSETLTRQQSNKWTVIIFFSNQRFLKLI